VVEEVIKICHAWFTEGMADECFWEDWPGQPVCNALTPRMVIEAINMSKLNLTQQDDML
jgi:hypothetical protein